MTEHKILKKNEILIKANQMNKFHYRWPIKNDKPRNSTLCSVPFWEKDIKEEKLLKNINNFDVCSNCIKIIPFS